MYLPYSLSFNCFYHKLNTIQSLLIAGMLPSWSCLLSLSHWVLGCQPHSFAVLQHATHVTARGRLHWCFLKRPEACHHTLCRDPLRCHLLREGSVCTCVKWLSSFCSNSLSSEHHWSPDTAYMYSLFIFLQKHKFHRARIQIHLFIFVLLEIVDVWWERVGGKSHSFSLKTLKLI